MHTGTGIMHSEVNDDPATPLHLLQIWLGPTELGVAPGYGQRPFPVAERAGEWVRIAAPAGEGGDILPLYADARLDAARLPPGASLDLALLTGTLEAAAAAAPKVVVPTAVPAAGTAAIVSTTLHGGLSLMTILGLTGAGLALAATITLTAVYGLSGADGAGTGGGIGPAPAVEPVPAVVEPAAVQADDPPVTFEFVDLDLADAITFISMSTGRKLTVKGGKDAPPITLKAESMKLSVVIKWLEQLSGATITVREPASP